MLTAETKRHIDAARQVLVGVVPNPAAQIDQITNALIYKFMDDMDQSAFRAGDKPSFFVGELESYSWTRLMDTKIGNQERMDIYVRALEKFSNSQKLPELFRDIFRQAYLPFRSPDVLYLFLKEINYFGYSHSEELGNAYEYLLSILSAQGDAGQFRTPRNIIDFIVEVVDPTPDDTVLDPACGTAGFLISAYKHILKKYSEIDKKTGKIKSTLTPTQRQKMMKNFEGYDISPEMVKLSRVNMYLHNFKNPKIYEYDTLSHDERWDDKFSVILANPPFMSPKGGIKPHSRFSIQSSRSEVLFVDYFIDHLKKANGRAGMIVPEGIIFQSGTAHKQLRKNLIDDGLYAVVSLPPGVFSPYSGVKTSILFFDNNLVKKEKRILFVKVQYDGTDLGTRKRAVENNDLPTAKAVIEQFRKGDFISSPIAHVVSKEEILKTEDYNLSGDRYRTQETLVGRFDRERLISHLEESSVRVGKNSEIISVWSVSNKNGFVLSTAYFDKQVASTNTSNYKIVRPGFFAYNPSRINVGSLAFNDGDQTGSVSPMYVVFSIKDKERLLPEYLYFLLKSEDFNEQVLRLAQGSVRQQLRFKDLASIEIPIPSLTTQKLLVNQIASYIKLIEGAEAVVDNWKPRVEIDPTWKKVRLSSLIKELEAGVSVNSESRQIREGEKGVLKTSAVTYGVFDPKENKKIIDSEIKRARISPKANSIIISRMNTPQLVGASVYIEKDWKNLYLPDRLWQLVPMNENFSMKFLSYLISSENFRDLLTGISGGTSGSMKNISKAAFLELEISLPSLKVQEKIVNQIEAEQKYIDSVKDLIEIYKEKMSKVLRKIWE